LVFRGVGDVLRKYKPAIVAQEGNLGSQNARAASALARAQQACADAVFAALESFPLFVTVQAVKKLATGSQQASKDQMEAAMRRRWPSAPFEELLKGIRRGAWENAFDAAAVAHAVWDDPAVASVRRLAAA
jgi:Holliday junction resolvasome RuvABC endonuclease subunit